MRISYCPGMDANRAMRAKSLLFRATGAMGTRPIGSPMPLGFFTVAIMLSLLIFVGEAVRDAFDPRKTFG